MRSNSETGGEKEAHCLRTMINTLSHTPAPGPYDGHFLPNSETGEREVFLPS